MKIVHLLEKNAKQRRNAVRKAQKAGNVAQPNTAGAGAFGNIANTLTPDPSAPAASSTGGVTTPTTTGLTHAASPTNPNQPKPETLAKSPSGYNPQTGAAFNSQEERDAYFAQSGQVDPRKAGEAPAAEPEAPAETPAAAPEAPANAAGGAGQKVGGVVQNVKNAWNDAKQGYQAGRTQAAPPGQPNQTAGGGQGGHAIAQINTRLDRVEQALGIAEGKVFHSKFLGIDI